MSEEEMNKLAGIIVKKLGLSYPHLADMIAKKIISEGEKHEAQIKQEFIVHDNFGNTKSVSEKEYLMIELERLNHLEKMYVSKEEYEKANIIKNKIVRVKLRINNLK
tara:strand:- start:74 stop:394 length:321 start_codon:yes stop_codon:yes gene_type:complete